MGDIYRRLGVRTVINAAGTQTSAGGTLMDPEVLEAMTEASRHFVRIAELQEAAGRVIADVTGAEAGYVTSGASAGITLAVAAAVVGMDIAKMDRLPDTTGMKNEVVVQRAHRNDYDHAARVAGVTLVEVGTLGFPGRGGTSPWQIESAINERTAAVLCPIMDSPGTVPLPVVCQIAHRRGIPVVVDAAAALPPVSNLRRFVAEGADAVIFSGGKAIGGPQASGIVAGRRAIVESIALQHQDMDVYPDTWALRQRYLESGAIAGAPHQGLGRGFKVGKEEIVGLIVALQRYVARDHAAEQARWRRTAEWIAAELDGVDHLRIELFTDPNRPIPQVRLHLDEPALGLTAFALVNRLADGEPNVLVAEGFAYRGTIGVNPMTLREGDAEIVVRRIKACLAN
jgi:L-seryl-tRNA(Ser) seleniumtransferase